MSGRKKSRRPRIRRGRGVDFAGRLQGSRWAEDLLIQEFRRHHFIAVRIGLSGITKDNTIGSSNSRVKAPDLLLFNPNHLSQAQKALVRATHWEDLEIGKLPEGSRLARLASLALCGIEVEFSPYRAAEMRGRNWATRLLNKLRWPKKALAPIAPSVIVKLEDLPRLTRWRRTTGIPIVVIHVFDQEAFSIDLGEVERFERKFTRQRPKENVRLQLTKGIFRVPLGFDRSDAQGARETKLGFRIVPAATKLVGKVRKVRVKAKLFLSSSKKYVSHVHFERGKIEFNAQFLDYLRNIRQE